jgi:heme oxygenase
LLRDENSTAIIPNFPTNLDHNNSNSYYNKGKSRWNRLKEDLDNLYNKTLQTIIETRPATQASIDKSLNLYKQWLKNAELVTNKLTELYLNQFI